MLYLENKVKTCGEMNSSLLNTNPHATFGAVLAMFNFSQKLLTPFIHPTIQLSFELPVALFSTPVVNLLFCVLIVSAAGNVIASITGKIKHTVATRIGNFNRVTRTGIGEK